MPEALRKRIQATLLQHFRPEFINRVDEIVIFNPLGKSEIEKIIDLQAANLLTVLAERKITIELSDKARELLFREGYDPQFGARPLKRAIQRLIQDPLAMKILDGEVMPGDTIEVKESSKQLVTVLEASQLAERDVPEFYEVDHSKMTAKLVRVPLPNEVPYAVMMEPNLVIEFYSR